MFSFCVSSWWLPVSHPNRLCQEHVRQLSYSKRLLVDGYTSTASSGNRRIGALNQNKRLLRFGLTAKRQRDVPTHVGVVLAVSAGVYHTCAVRSDGQLVRFGWNTDGQCDVPTNLGAVLAVSAGAHHTCAVRSDGQLVCFWMERLQTVRCADRFGSSCGSLSRRVSHVCSEIRWSVSALDGSTADSAMCRRIWEQLWQSQQAATTRVQ